nr:hypothetical protein [Tanacetum cinerariifolium]
DDAERDDDDDDDDEEEIAKTDEQDDAERGRDDDEETESDEESDSDETREEESFDPIPRTPEDSEDDGNGEGDQGLRISKEERIHEEEEADELYHDVDINQGRGLQLSQDIEDYHVTLTSVHYDGQQESSSVSSQFVTSMLNPTSDAGMEFIFATASSSVAPLQTSSPIMTPSTIATITSISHAPIPPTTIPSDVLQNLPTFDLVFRFDERLKSFKASISEYRQTNPFAKVVSNIPADLSEMELKKILIEKMEGNKTCHLKRRRDDDDDDDDDQGEGPFAGSDRGSKRQREGKETESASALLEPATRSIDRYTTGSKSRQASASESAFAEEPVQTTSQIEEPSHPVFETGAEDQPIVQSSQHPEWFSQPKKTPSPDRDWNKTLPVARGSTQSWISDLGSCNSLTELEYHLEEVYKATTDQLDWVNPKRGRRVTPFAYFINNDLKYLRGGASSRKYTTSVTKTKAADYENIKWIEDLGWKRQQFYGFVVNRESALDVSKRRIIAVTDLKIVEWHSYKHLDWITVRRDDDKPYNIVIQRRVEDLQLGVESYQKKLNLTKTDTYRSDLKRREAYNAYSNPRGFIYQNKDKKNRLMRLDELYKFSDGTLNDVRNALDDRLKGIRMQYLPQTIWRKCDKDRAAAMIQAIDKMLKTRRIMRSLERFVGRRLYEGDFQMLQRTI